MNKTLAGLLYSATALTFIGTVEPAMALPPYPGQPTAAQAGEVEVNVAYLCQGTGPNGWLPPGTTPGPTTGFGAGVDISNGNGMPPQTFYWVDQCDFFTDYNTCMAAAEAAESDGQPIANWYMTNKYQNVVVYIDPSISSGSYCLTDRCATKVELFSGGFWARKCRFPKVSCRFSGISSLIGNSTLFAQRSVICSHRGVEAPAADNGRS